MSLQEALDRKVVLIGGIPVRIVKSQTHALGNVAVGHAVGKGVRLHQAISSKQPEQLQLVCVFLGTDKYKSKLALEQLHNLKVPFPFVSNITALPFVTITSLVFLNNSNRKDMDGSPVLDFSITLSEYKVNYFVKLGVKLAWLAWTLATSKDPSDKLPLYTSDPDDFTLSSVVTTEYIVSNAIDVRTAQELGQPTNTTWGSELINDINDKNRYFDKLPFNPNGIFPQTIKLEHPTVSSKILWNSVTSGYIPTGYNGYIYPTVNSTTQKYQFILTINAKMSSEGTTYTMIVKDSSQTLLFSRKILPEVIYTIGKFEFTFNEIFIDPRNINPSNMVGGTYGSKLIGGLRQK